MNVQNSCKQPSDQQGQLDLNLQNGSDSLFINSLNTVRTEGMQPPELPAKSMTYADNPLRPSLSIISQKKVCAQESSNSYNTSLKNKNSSNAFKMVDMRKRPNPQKLVNGQHRHNMRSSQITTSRVKSNSFLT